ncbi:MAG: hypothetical protein R2710_09845 [Acidimicrobiales bacterium]
METMSSRGSNNRHTKGPGAGAVDPTGIRRQLVLRWLVPGLVAAGLAAACGEIEPPDLGAEITVATTIDTDQDAAVASQSDEPVPLEAQAPLAVLPPRDPGYVSVVVLGTPDGVSSGPFDDLAPLAEPLGSLSTDAVADDLFGGLVVDASGSGVLWYAAEGAEAVAIRPPGVRLLDVGYLNNTAEALVLVDDKLVERVRLFDLEAEPIIVLDDADELLDFSAAGGLYAVTVGNEECGRIGFLNSLGDPVGIAGPTVVECPVPRRATFTLIDLSPDGDAMAYTEVTYRSDGVEASTELVGAELSSGVELFRIPVGGAGDRISSLSFDGRRVVFVRTPLEGDNRDLVLIDAVTDGLPVEEVAPLPRSGAFDVSFARLPLKVGADSNG